MINIVSAISSAGMAVGTAALIIILSVYNGFDGLIKSMMSSVEPDFMIVPSQGKFFVPEGEAYSWMQNNPDILSVCTVLQDNVFVDYDGQQATAVVKGVDQTYQQESVLGDYVTDGEFGLRMGERYYAAVGQSLASSLDMNIRFRSPLVLYYPGRGARISPLNPMSSLNSEYVWPCCEFGISSQEDSRLVLVDQDVMRSLTGLDDEVSAVEIRLVQGVSARGQKNLKKNLQKMLGPQYRVLDRSEQNPSLYSMLVYEKLALYLIMMFVVLILGFSIFGSLSMLIIDKKDDIAILRAMGMKEAGIRQIFTLEGWFITLAGMAVGMLFGIGACLAQQRFGLISMPPNFVVDSYPVVVDIADVLISAALISVSGYIIALIPSRKLEIGE